MRFLASILFAMMTLVLPTAGVTRSFCTVSMTFVADNGRCPMDADDCCCGDDKHHSPQPDCMIATKLLPNADKSPAPQIPEADGEWVWLPALIADFPPVPGVHLAPALCQRGLPVIPDPLYLTQRRLLI